MAIVNQGKPSRMKSVYGHNSTDAVGVVYTCPPNCVAECTFIHVVNGGGSTNIDLVLQPGDKIQVHPTTAGHIDTIVTVTETFVPVG
jgi:hypothetical protein